MKDKRRQSRQKSHPGVYSPLDSNTGWALSSLTSRAHGSARGSFQPGEQPRTWLRGWRSLQSAPGPLSSVLSPAPVPRPTLHYGTLHADCSAAWFLFHSKPVLSFFLSSRAGVIFSWAIWKNLQLKKRFTEVSPCTRAPKGEEVPHQYSSRASNMGSRPVPSRAYWELWRPGRPTCPFTKYDKAKAESLVLLTNFYKVEKEIVQKGRPLCSSFQIHDTSTIHDILQQLSDTIIKRNYTYLTTNSEVRNLPIFIYHLTTTN